MKHQTSRLRLVLGVGILLAGATLASSARAGTYQTIDLSGSSSQFNDVSASYTEGTPSGDPIDVQSVKITNDSSYLYLDVTFDSAVNPNDGSAGESTPGANDGQELFLAFDLDDNTSTGFDVYGLGQVGSELGYQNDFPFQQAAGDFNTGATVVGGGALITNYDTSTTNQIIAIPLSSTAGGNTLFPSLGSTIGLALYSSGDSGTPSFAGAIDYDLAENVPEPSTWAMMVAGVCLLGVVVARRRATLRQ